MWSYENDVSVYENPSKCDMQYLNKVEYLTTTKENWDETDKEEDFMTEQALNQCASKIN
jgi:hypothetical protein